MTWTLQYRLAAIFDAVNGQEGITQRSRKVNAGSVAATQFASDATGNLQFDGRYLYQYDALGRLVQVNQKGTCTVDGTGKITGTPGPWVTHRTYDGLGRLIRTQAPWPSADLASSGFVVSRRFYVDPPHSTKGAPFEERENWHTNPQDIPVGPARPFSPARPG